MHTQLQEILHKLFERKLPCRDKRRFNCLIGAVGSLIVGSKLSLTALGRNLINNVTVRSNIKKISRLLANKHLFEESFEIYRTLARKIISNRTRICIHVDWSCICESTRLYLLRATLSMPGRSVVLYEECHAKKYHNNHFIHKNFLDRLKNILPETVTPIIVADAGFRAPWFDYIYKLGWHFVGRLRNKNLVKLESEKEWRLSSAYFSGSTTRPRPLGKCLLTLENRVPVYLISYKCENKKRHRVNLNKKISQSSKSKYYSKANKEPWILVTSLKQPAIKTVKIYTKRMQIEESFRDTKCIRYGFGLDESRTRSPNRMKILLLIAAIASLAAWLAGLHATINGQAPHFQSCSTKHKNGISIVFLGRQVLKRKLRLSKSQINSLWKALSNLAHSEMVPIV